MAAEQAGNVPTHRGRAQVRRRRIDGVAVVRGTVVGGAGGAVAVATARGRLLRHPGPRPGRPSHHAAQAYRRNRRRLAPQAARRPRRPHRGANAAGRRRRRRGAGRSDATSCWPSCATGRWRPVARISTDRTVDLLYGPDGIALAEFCDDKVTASAGEGDDAAVARVGARTRRGRRRAPHDLLDRLANRLLDAGAEPAGHGSKLARVLARRRATTATAEPAQRVQVDPIHRGGRRADRRAARVGPGRPGRRLRLGAPDAGHHPQDPQPAAGVGGVPSASPTTRGFSTSCGSWPVCSGWRATPRCSPSATRSALDELPDDMVRGPIRERLVEGAKRRYQAGLRRSLIAMRSERYFRLLDALDGLVAAEPPAADGGRRARTGRRSTRPTSGCARRRRTPRGCGRRRARRGAAPNSQGRQATPLHGGGDRRRQGVRPGQDHPDPAR